ncbi:hypothetical protein NEMBOFW57_004142 [Staphylotrichum longicolle]|uniref:Uncharacterized protein n=1 Tax=Staphylotrichum longicolle TaxID=669026 RepID=A0AAD4F7I9_9PEZI|nr:hypothetical protein NEMBOFW57_004142 [Staphylotrichum longicolle]
MRSTECLSKRYCCTTSLPPNPTATSSLTTSAVRPHAAHRTVVHTCSVLALSLALRSILLARSPSAAKSVPGPSSVAQSFHTPRAASDWAGAKKWSSVCQRGVSNSGVGSEARRVSQ